jgi:BirA family biotin operon repressor/biotin-[acetyl-CoA-carboxylase] ligase
MNITILGFDSLDSTNTEAIEQAKRGANEGLCVVAQQQTAGRGRHGRTWVSEKDSGLYFSIVLRPKIETKFLSLITLMTSIVVYEVLQELYKLKPDIKWSNDVHINDKKICGILAETSETNKGLAVIVGIGINLTSKNFPAELSKTATSIEQETNQKPDKNELLTSLTQFFTYFYNILQSKNGAKRIGNEWANRSSYFEGKEVKVTLENKTIYGTTCGLEENGALRIKTGTGEIKIIQAGDVERLRNT